MIAFDMSKYSRVVESGDGRIRGAFHVLGYTENSKKKIIWIKAIDVTIYDEGMRGGVVLGKDDLTASVQDGRVHIQERSGRWNAQIAEVKPELLVLLKMVAQVWEAGTESQVGEEGVEKYGRHYVIPDHQKQVGTVPVAPVAVSDKPICKHCGHEIVNVGGVSWAHPYGNGILGRCQSDMTEYGYNAAPVGQPCEDPCLGTVKPDPNERLTDDSE